MKVELRDWDYMPFGIYKGTKMKKVPVDYLIWCYENNRCSKDVVSYIHSRKDILKELTDRINKSKSRS
jgi:hypothetical protein